MQFQVYMCEPSSYADTDTSSVMSDSEHDYYFDMFIPSRPFETSLKRKTRQVSAPITIPLSLHNNKRLNMFEVSNVIDGDIDEDDPIFYSNTAFLCTYGRRVKYDFDKKLSTRIEQESTNLETHNHQDIFEMEM